MLAILKQQLRSAIGRQQRWNALRDEMHGENYKNWKHVSDLNQAGIEHLRRLLVCEAEYELRRSFASRGKQTAEDGLKKII